MEELTLGQYVALLGFGLGTAFGATAQKTDFCTMGALSDAVFMGEWNRFRAWMLAIAVAMLGSQAMHVAGLVDLSKSIYLTTNLGWAGAILGGLMFGFGMVLGSGCGNKTLVRVGGGNLKSLVVMLVLGIFAYMTQRGLTGLARVEIESAANVDLATMGLKNQGIPEILMSLGLPAQAAQVGVPVVIGLGLLWYCFKDSEFRASTHNVVGGLIIGALIPACWYVTGVIGFDEFEPVPVESVSFVSPVGNGLQYVMTFTGSTINFGIAVVGGVIFGSFLAAKLSGRFNIEAFTDSGDMGRHLIGAALMGVGGIMALGCTVGQGITGMSTLAIGSLIALLSIMAGGVLGLKYMEEGTLGGAVAAVLGRGD